MNDKKLKICFFTILLLANGFAAPRPEPVPAEKPPTEDKPLIKEKLLPEQKTLIENKPLAENIRDRNNAFASFLLSNIVDDIRLHRFLHPELAYIDEYADLDDSREPVFACVEFTYKPFTHPRKEKKFMDGGYSFGIWLWDLWCGPPSILEPPVSLPLGLGINGMKTRDEFKKLGIGVAIAYEGEVPMKVVNLLESFHAKMESLHGTDFWQGKTDKINAGIFIVTPPAEGSSEIILSFGMSNNSSQVWDYDFRMPYIIWMVDDKTPFQVQGVDHRFRKRSIRDRVQLPPGRAMMFKPFKVSLAGAGRHQVKAILRSSGNNCVLQAEIEVMVK